MPHAGAFIEARLRARAQPTCVPLATSLCLFLTGVLLFVCVCSPLCFDRLPCAQVEGWLTRGQLVRHYGPGSEELVADLCSRIEPFLIELEQQTSPCLVVSHLSVLQVLASYFTGSPLEEALNMSIPHHTVLQFTPCTDTMMWQMDLLPLTAEKPSVE